MDGGRGVGGCIRVGESEGVLGVGERDMGVSERASQSRPASGELHMVLPRSLRHLIQSLPLPAPSAPHNGTHRSHKITKETACDRTPEIVWQTQNCCIL